MHEDVEELEAPQTADTDWRVVAIGATVNGNPFEIHHRRENLSNDFQTRAIRLSYLHMLELDPQDIIDCVVSINFVACSMRRL